MSECVFCKIIAGEIPAVKIWENDSFIAFLDAFPACP
jgi:histidine triad (HIT) family protein